MDGHGTSERACQSTASHGLLEAGGTADVGAAARKDAVGVGDAAVVAERQAAQLRLGRDAPAADAAALRDVAARPYEVRSSAGSASGSSAASASGAAASGAGSSAPSSAGTPSPRVSSTPGTSSASSSGGAPPR